MEFEADNEFSSKYRAACSQEFSHWNRFGGNRRMQYSFCRINLIQRKGEWESTSDTESSSREWDGRNWQAFSWLGIVRDFFDVSNYLSWKRLLRESALRHKYRSQTNCTEFVRRASKVGSRTIIGDIGSVRITLEWFLHGRRCSWWTTKRWSNSQDEVCSCWCTTTSIGEIRTTSGLCLAKCTNCVRLCKNSFLWVIDHCSDQFRTRHGMRQTLSSLNSWWRISRKVVNPYFVQQVHWTEDNWKVKEENDQFISARMSQPLRQIFALLFLPISPVYTEQSKICVKNSAIHCFGPTKFTKLKNKQSLW